MSDGWFCGKNIIAAKIQFRSGEAYYMYREERGMVAKKIQNEHVLDVLGGAATNNVFTDRGPEGQ